MKKILLSLGMICSLVFVTSCSIRATTYSGRVYAPAVAPAVYTPAYYPGSPYWGGSGIYAGFGPSYTWGGPGYSWGNRGYWGNNYYWRGYRSMYRFRY